MRFKYYTGISYRDDGTVAGESYQSWILGNFQIVYGPGMDEMKRNHHEPVYRIFFKTGILRTFETLRAAKEYVRKTLNEK